MPYSAGHCIFLLLALAACSNAQVYMFSLTYSANTCQPAELLSIRADPDSCFPTLYGTYKKITCGSTSAIERECTDAACTEGCTVWREYTLHSCSNQTAWDPTFTYRYCSPTTDTLPDLPNGAMVYKQYIGTDNCTTSVAAFHYFVGKPNYCSDPSNLLYSCNANGIRSFQCVSPNCGDCTNLYDDVRYGGCSSSSWEPLGCVGSHNPSWPPPRAPVAPPTNTPPALPKVAPTATPVAVPKAVSVANPYQCDLHSEFPTLYFETVQPGRDSHFYSTCCNTVDGYSQPPWDGFTTRWFLSDAQRAPFVSTEGCQYAMSWVLSSMCLAKDDADFVTLVDDSTVPHVYEACIIRNGTLYNEILNFCTDPTNGALPGEALIKSDYTSFILLEKVRIKLSIGERATDPRRCLNAGAAVAPFVVVTAVIVGTVLLFL